VSGGKHIKVYLSVVSSGIVVDEMMKDSVFAIGNLVS